MFQTRLERMGPEALAAKHGDVVANRAAVAKAGRRPPKKHDEIKRASDLLFQDEADTLSAAEQQELDRLAPLDDGVR